MDTRVIHGRTRCVQDGGAVHPHMRRLTETAPRLVGTERKMGLGIATNGGAPISLAPSRLLSSKQCFVKLSHPPPLPTSREKGQWLGGIISLSFSVLFRSLDALLLQDGEQTDKHNCLSHTLSLSLSL